ncbi:MAG: DUF4398 domain-containing protein [Candidatus Binatia bacterium]
MADPKFPAGLGVLALIILCGAVQISACSTVGPPTAIVSKAELAVLEAGARKATRYAPLELRIAREKLDRAKQAINADEYTTARRLAEQALVDAQLAEAKADAEIASQNAEELQKTIEALSVEAEKPPTRN